MEVTSGGEGVVGRGGGEDRATAIYSRYSNLEAPYQVG